MPWHEAIAQQSPHLSFKTVWMAHYQQVHLQKPTEFDCEKKKKETRALLGIIHFEIIGEKANVVFDFFMKSSHDEATSVFLIKSCNTTKIMQE